MVINSMTLSRIEDIVKRHMSCFKCQIVKIQICEKCGFNITIKVGRNKFELKNNFEVEAKNITHERSGFVAKEIYKKLVEIGVFNSER